MAKGQDFERLLCKQLSLWWSNGEDDNIFWRTSNSGGRATTRAKAGKKANIHCGDIGVIDPIGEPLLRVISWELKRGYSRATIHDLLDKPDKAKTQIYEEWFTKAERDRQRSGALYWALVHKRDRREPLIWLPMALMNEFMAKDVMTEDRVIHGCFSIGNLDVCCTHLQTFLNGVNPQDILDILQGAQAARKLKEEKAG